MNETSESFGAFRPPTPTASPDSGLESDHSLIIVAQPGRKWPTQLSSQLGGRAQVVLVMAPADESAEKIAARVARKARSAPRGRVQMRLLVEEGPRLQELRGALKAAGVYGRLLARQGRPARAPRARSSSPQAAA